MPTPPRRRLRIDRGARTPVGSKSQAEPFDFTLAMRRLCEDVCDSLPEFAHIDMRRVAVTFAQAKKRVPHGLQAKLTPLRFEDGATTTVRRGVTYAAPTLHDGQVELLYVLTFYLPRFLDHTPQEKLTTVLHELHHVSPDFNGDIRRFPGRCYAHSHSQAQYDAEMAILADRYLEHGPPGWVDRFLGSRFADLKSRHGAVVGLKLPIPKLIPVGRV
ncbi:putative metallopeptidase [Alienimonas californiensis]|uniref:putative metallopeptidase n=1 Tax=Alienimonas californiensis TaxID=2527989 RepID=UPI001F6152FF|nr:putative metallopeptidase [Alienimonas californiensis]